MAEFTLHTIESAPEGARSRLQAIDKAWKFIPNLHRELAESPVTLQAYDTLFGLFAKSSFTPQEQQVVYLSAIYVNECEYCMAGHSALAEMAKLPNDIVQAIREDRAVANVRMQALRDFTQAMTRQRGMVGEASVDAFLAAGFTHAQVLEVVLAIATKVISNYTNHVAHTPNDAFMKNTAWTAPSRRAAV